MSKIKLMGLFFGSGQEIFFLKLCSLEMMMMNCFCGMVDWRKAFSLISSRGHCQGSPPLRIPTRREQDLKQRRILSLGFV